MLPQQCGGTLEFAEQGCRADALTVFAENTCSI
jgi:hypothetical protein